MNQETRAKIIEYHSRGLTVNFITARLKLSKAEVKEVLKEEIRKDFEGLFN